MIDKLVEVAETFGDIVLDKGGKSVTVPLGINFLAGAVQGVCHAAGVSGFPEVSLVIAPAGIIGQAAYHNNIYSEESSGCAVGVASGISASLSQSFGYGIGVAGCLFYSVFS